MSSTDTIGSRLSTCGTVENGLLGALAALEIFWREEHEYGRETETEDKETELYQDCLKLQQAHWKTEQSRREAGSDSETKENQIRGSSHPSKETSQVSAIGSSM